ncbi:hypothetical protein GCM10023187_14210 [Nibrella viscosa]|uniref:Phosphatidate cytidylyltransferase n=1 Tax=Nibrella viscosa TaxID=1084524 RepID=A0ABP8K6C9_9BACT
MKNRQHSFFRQVFSLLLIVCIGISLSSCEIIGDIFKAGAWFGIILVVGIIALAIWLLSKLFRRG